MGYVVCMYKIQDTKSDTRFVYLKIIKILFNEISLCGHASVNTIPVLVSASLVWRQFSIITPKYNFEKTNREIF